MKQAYRRWACGLLALWLALLTLCAAVVYMVDPCMYYRMPEARENVFFSERYQSAGLAKNVQADTVVVGTSMAANYRASQIEEIFGGAGVRITIPDGYFSEFDKVMGVLFRYQSPERVIVALDMNTLVRDESGLTSSMPEYLYNRNPLDDVKYLLNKDTLYYSAYVLMADEWGEAQPLDEGFTMGKGIWWNHATALDNYTRPEIAQSTLPADAYLEDLEKNLAVIARWVTEHPDTEFDLFLSPYSVLYWDKNGRLGQTEAVFAALERVCEKLTAYENVKLYGFLMDAEIVDNLDYYCDYIHHSKESCGVVLQKIAADEGRLTAENYQETIANWRDFVVDYDYEKFWDTDFWLAWNQAHPVT